METNTKPNPVEAALKDSDKPFACDIETMPQENCLRYFEPVEDRIKHPGEFTFKPPSNWKDQEKIDAKEAEMKARHEKAVEEYETLVEEDIDAQEEKFLQAACLTPAFGRIVAIGYLKQNEEGMMAPFIDLARNPAYEEKVITRFFKELCGPNFKRRGKAYGHNFHQFDLPFIVHRARLLQLPVLDRVNMDLTSYSSWLESMITDTYQKLRGKAGRYNPQLFPRGSLKLDNLAKQVGCVSRFRQTECSGAEFAEHILSKDPELQGKAIDHLTADLLETWDVAKSMRL